MKAYKDHVINVNNLMSEADLLFYTNTARDEKFKSNDNSLSGSMVIFYCPFNHTYTKIEKYSVNEIISLMKNFQKDNFFIMQIDNDKELYEEIVKLQFKSELENIHKMLDLKLDYCFSPVDNLLCFNLSVLTNIVYDQVEKYLIQIFFFNNGLYIINKNCCDQILNIFISKLNFSEMNSSEFFEQAYLVKNNERSLINNMKLNSLLKKQMRGNRTKNKNKKLKKRISNNSKMDRSLSLVDSEKEQSEDMSVQSKEKKKKKGLKQTDTMKKLSPNAKFKTENLLAVIDTQDNSTEISNFSTDDLIYWLLTFSLEHLEKFARSLEEEADFLKAQYLEMGEKERSDFFTRLHSLEVSMQIVHQEAAVKKKFLKYSKAKFKIYNKLSHNFYFKHSFHFFIELMISKVIQIEMVFQKLDNTLDMIKENYSILIEDYTKKENVKLNNVMKLLAIITTVYAPLNIVPGLWGMNVKVPWRDVDTMWPFCSIIIFLVLFLLFQLLIFKKLKWF